MTVTSFSKTKLTKYLISLVVIFHITACSTEENFNGTSSGGVIGITPSSMLLWVAPSERHDGTGISMSEIAGYRIYYGTTQGSYPNQINIDNGSADQASLNSLASGTYYIVVTTIDTEGRESVYSDEVVRTI